MNLNDVARKHDKSGIENFIQAFKGFRNIVNDIAIEKIKTLNNFDKTITVLLESDALNEKEKEIQKAIKSTQDERDQQIENFQNVMKDIKQKLIEIQDVKVDKYK